MISSNSRNRLTVVVEQVNAAGRQVKPPFVDIRTRVDKTAADDTFITVRSSSSWARHALRQLGDARHWWVIADVSGVVDPFAELERGGKLRVPTIGRLLFDIISPDKVT